MNDFYFVDKLSDTIRSGHLHWAIKRHRLESVAEHIYECQRLAIKLYGDSELDVNINKVILMLSIHEEEENYIGDVTAFEERTKDGGHQAAVKSFNSLKRGRLFSDLLNEFEDNKTSEAVFTKYVDKLQSVLKIFEYDIESKIDIDSEDVKDFLSTNDTIIKMREEGARSLGDIFYLWYKDLFRGEIGKVCLDYLEDKYKEYKKEMRY
ncbi:MAG: HD domain-containing protein [Clostridia bacterium]|jgi:5'-deoxynucleotidase YfbR-like HD superfamily hydrolase|nr:HD domain-containing protein [Clostridia bacterium]